ncbi:hypothetical protein [Luteococcus sp. OSA5]|uniref:hypothetical protein n=1 Tax=Luteococcus sp. OSA5 TaxID=3401630 RepID=UPI003B439D76
MGKPDELIRLVQQQPTAQLPGKTSQLLWKAGAATVLALLLLATAASAQSTATRLLALVFGAGMAVAAVSNLVNLGRAPRLYRISPQGLSWSGSPPMPWPLIAGAFRTEQPNVNGPNEELAILSLTDEGQAWLRQHGTLRGRTTYRSDLRGIPMPLIKGCTTEQTAKVLSAAIRAHRSHLGLPPVV